MKKETDAGTSRRKSVFDAIDRRAPEMLPFELAKRPIRPLNVPSASQQLELRVLASTENELIVNNLEALEERKDPDRVWKKVNKYTAYAARGFGTFKPGVGLGVYGIEMQKSLRRQANGLHPTLRDLKIRVPITNRIASGMALFSWGADDGKTGPKDAIILGDCYPLDTRSFEQYKISGGGTEESGKQPTTVHMFVKMARQQSRLFAAAYGSEHLGERLDAIDRMSEIHEECPECFTVSFLSEMWERMMFQYNACVVEGIHFILAKYDEGVTFEKIRRYALAPDGAKGTAWKFTPIFDFADASGFWKSVIIPEIRQERQRQDITNLVAERGKPGNDRNRRNGERELVVVRRKRGHLIQWGRTRPC